MFLAVGDYIIGKGGRSDATHSAFSSIWRIIRLEKFDSGLEHLSSRNAFRKPMILSRKLYEFDRLSGVLEGTGHFLALPKWHNRIVAPMNEQNWNRDVVDVIDGRNGIEL